MALTGISAAFAQDDDDDVIVVTATKREQTLQDVPFSVNAQTQDDIQRTGSSSLEDVARSVASLTIQNLGPGQSQVAVRGVSAGQIVRDQPGVKEQVGVYLDESVISLSLFTPDIDLFDLNRVETLRGPQGTLFGSGSVGGTIRYITNQPRLGEYEGMVEGNVNVIDGGGTGGHGKGVINLPIGDTAAIRAVGYYTRYGGFIDALMDDASAPDGIGIENDVNSGSRAGGRIALRWEPTEGLAITPRVLYQEIEADGFNRQEVFNLYANPFTTVRTAVNFEPRRQFLRLDERFKDDTLIADLTVDWDVGALNFTSITTYTDRDILVSRDASALTGSVSVDLGFPDAAVLLPSNLRDTTEVEQFTQEARIASNYESRLQWLVGVFYTDIERVYAQRLPTPGYDAFQDQAAADSRLDADPSNDFPFAADTANGFGADSPFNSDLPYDFKQFAVFGEASYDVTDRLQVTAGGRYYDFEETRTITTGGLFAAGDTNVVDTTESDGFTPRVMASYDISDQVTLNAQASRGFRLGGVNDPLNVTLCTPQDEAIFGGFQDYDDETLWNYEAGAKVNTGRVRFNVAGFYTDIKNLQTTLDAGSCSSRIVFNVPEAHTMGVEWEFEAELTDNLEIAFAGSLLEAEFDSTVVDGTNAVIGGIEEGNRLPSVPEFQLSASAVYTYPLSSTSEGFFAASFQHIGDRITQPSDQLPGAGMFTSGLAFGGASGNDVTDLDLILDPYQIVNLQAGIAWDNMELVAYVNNVTDENANLSFDRERGGRARLGFRTNQPRTFGVTARVRF